MCFQFHLSSPSLSILSFWMQQLTAFLALEDRYYAHDRLILSSCWQTNCWLCCAWSMNLQRGILDMWWGADCSQILTFQRPLDLSQSMYLLMNLCTKNCGRSWDIKWKMVESWFIWVFRCTLNLSVCLFCLWFNSLWLLRYYHTQKR